MFWLLGTQGRRSCLAPTLDFVVERRWRSIPASIGPRTGIGTAITAFGATRIGVTNTNGVPTKTHTLGIMNTNGVPQQRAGLPPQGGYPVLPEKTPQPQRGCIRRRVGDYAGVLGNLRNPVGTGDKPNSRTGLYPVNLQQSDSSILVRRSFRCPRTSFYDPESTERRTGRRPVPSWRFGLRHPGFRQQAGCSRGQAEGLSYTSCSPGPKKTPLKIARNLYCKIVPILRYLMVDYILGQPSQI
jgi:hypothetical protein